MEIGQIVKWQTAGKQMQGLWIESVDDTFDEVMCTKAGTVNVALTCRVPKELLEIA